MHVRVGARTTIQSGDGGTIEIDGDVVRPVASPPFPVPVAFAPLTYQGVWPNTLVTLAVDVRARAGSGCRNLLFRDGSWRDVGVFCDAQIAASDAGVALFGTIPHPPLTPARRGLSVARDGSKGANLAEGDDPSACPARLEEPRQMAMTPDGALFIVGDECVTKRTIVERWPLNDDVGAIDVLPGPCNESPAIRAIAARSATEVWVGGSACGRGYVARFDGAAWNVIEAPGDTVRALALTNDEAWALASEGDPMLLERGADGLWKEVAGVPNMWDIRARGDDVWIETPRRIYRNRAPTQVAKVAPQSGLTFGRWPSCDALFVQIAIISESTPRDYDFPLTRAALAGQDLTGTRFVVTTSRAFGAIVPDAATGERLASVIGAALKSSPQLLCMKPDVDRVVSFHSGSR
jgi:hypothetical protein